MNMMSRVAMAAVLLCSSAFGDEADKQEIESLKKRVAELERVVQFLLLNPQKGAGLAVPVPVVLEGNRSKKDKLLFMVTLTDNSSFLITRWERKTVKYRDEEGKIKTGAKYIMYDTDGKSSQWNIDKVESIEPLAGDSK